jgi:hypothetical protein
MVLTQGEKVAAWLDTERVLPNNKGQVGVSRFS